MKYSVQISVETTDREVLKNILEKVKELLEPIDIQGTNISVDYYVEEKGEKESEPDEGGLFDE